MKLGKGFLASFLSSTDYFFRLENVFQQLNDGFMYYATKPFQSKIYRKELTYQYQTERVYVASSEVGNNLFVFKLLKENLQLEFLF